MTDDPQAGLPEVTPLDPEPFPAEVTELPAEEPEAEPRPTDTPEDQPGPGAPEVPAETVPGQTTIDDVTPPEPL